MAEHPYKSWILAAREQIVALAVGDATEIDVPNEWWEWPILEEIQSDLRGSELYKLCDGAKVICMLVFDDDKCGEAEFANRDCAPYARIAVAKVKKD
jgi:hypothetical protein